MKARTIRGFNDILPESVKRWHYIEDAARGVFERYGFSEIRTPVLEFTELFQRSIGAATDIVEKEMYTFDDRDGSSLTLRPEGTAGVVRAFIEHSMGRKSAVTKLYYMGTMYRHERPQKGRYRAFNQIGAEYLGSDEPYADAETITMLWRFLEEIGLADALTLELSSLGDGESRAGYKDKLVDYFSAHVNELCGDCTRRLEENPLRILDCKKERCSALAEGAPSILDNLSEESRRHFEAVMGALDATGVPYTLNPRIVRGLDYYCKTVFEITTAELGAQNAVAAGGRYDGLVEELGGKPTPAVGFAVGMERLILLLEKVSPEGFDRRPDAFIAYVGEEAKAKAYGLADELRRGGLFVELEYEGRSLKSQLKRADKLGAGYAVIIGEDELGRGIVKLRDMESGTEEDVAPDGLSARLGKGRGGRGGEKGG